MHVCFCAAQKASVCWGLPRSAARLCPLLVCDLGQLVSLCCRVLICQWGQWRWACFLRCVWGFRVSVPSPENSAWHVKALCTRLLLLELVAWDRTFQGPLFCDYICCDQWSSTRFSLWFHRPQCSFCHTVSTHTYLCLLCAGNTCPQ